MHAYVPANISGIQYLVAGGYQSLTRIRYLTGQTDVRALRRA